MPNFAKQLIAARKAKAMTQEQLAQAVHISRSRISRWETGDAVPDLEMIRLLSEVLEFDFLASGEKEAPEQATEESPAESPAQEPAVSEAATGEEAASVKPVYRKPWFLACAGGAALVIIALVIALFTGVLAPAQVYEPLTAEWYQQTDARVKDQAYVTVQPEQNPTKAIHFAEFPNGVGWFYTFYCDETNGVPFTVTKITQTVFSHVGADHMEYTGADLLRVMQGDDVLRTDRPKRMTFTGGFPLQKVSGVGLLVEGVDANGKELSFRGYVELSQEIAE